MGEPYQSPLPLLPGFTLSDPKPKASMPDTALADPYRLQLPRETQDALYSELCRIVKETWEACTDRDDDLFALREQLEGVSQPNTNSPWPGAAEVESSISRELHTTLHAALSSACRQTPYVAYEPLDPTSRDDAAKNEQYINLKAQEYGYEEALSDTIYLALEGRYAPMHVGLEQRISRSFRLRDDQLVLDETPVEDRVVYRPVDPWDFHVYPVTARGPQPEHGCLLAIERMSLTREDLLMGVLYNGFDKKAVDEMIARGPATTRDHDDQADRDGINVDAATSQNTKQAGTWECAFVIGRAPYLENDKGNPTIPPGMIHTDCMWMVCPALEVGFKQSYSRYDDGARPYSLHHVIRKPNRMLGEGIVSIVSQIHEEMTCIERFGLNNMNLEASPVLTATEAWLTRYSAYTIAPGRILPRQASDPIGPKPLTWDTGSQQLVMEWLGWLDAQAQRAAATQGINSAGAGKTRKAAEIHAAEAIQASKFDHYVHNLQYGVKEDMRLTRSLLLRRMREKGEDEATAVAPDGTPIAITAEQLAAHLHDVPQASSDSMSPATRLAKQQLVDAITMSYWQALPRFAQFKATGYLYALKFRLLMLAGERNPQHYIGPNPETDQGAAQTAQAMAQQQMMQQMMGQQQGNGQGGGGNGVGPVNFLGAGDNGAGLMQASPLTPRGGGE